MVWVPAAPAAVVVGADVTGVAGAVVEALGSDMVTFLQKVSRDQTLRVFREIER